MVDAQQQRREALLGLPSKSAQLEIESEDARLARLEAECRASLQGSISTLSDTRVTAADTLTTMEGQSEQLVRIQGKLDSTESNLKVADRHLRSIDSWVGAVSNLFRRRPRAVHTDMERHVAFDGRGEDASASGFPGGESDSDELLEGRRIAEQGVLDEPFADELNQISGDLGALKQMALAMGREADEQSGHIDKITDSVTRVDGHIRRDRMKIGRML
jgi:hypothetical protein